jgi:hypothetical protein
MKNIFYLFIFFLGFQINAQILNMPESIQENDQWCWAGVTKSILNYYGEIVEQCEIADYARTQITWHDFGDTDCCVNPNLGCNYWNYAFGANGSMQDILVHFGNIQNYGISSDLSMAQITTNLVDSKPFIVRWGWNSGGGHFVVGHGISGNSIYYMDPWFGEGLHVSTYSWLQNDGNHTWTHTNVITTSASLSVDNNVIANVVIEIYPNPTKDRLSIESTHSINEIEIYNPIGQQILKTTQVENINLSNFKSGIYSLKINIEDHVFVKKLIIK